MNINAAQVVSNNISSACTTVVILSQMNWVKDITVILVFPPRTYRCAYIESNQLCTGIVATCDLSSSKCSQIPYWQPCWHYIVLSLSLICRTSDYDSQFQLWTDLDDYSKILFWLSCVGTVLCVMSNNIAFCRFWISMLSIHLTLTVPNISKLQSQCFS